MLVLAGLLLTSAFAAGTKRQARQLLQSDRNASAVAEKLSVTALASALPSSFSIYSMPGCKRTNADSDLCGVEVSSIWRFPACCSRGANFSATDTGIDCDYEVIPYTDGWSGNCSATKVPACCQEAFCGFLSVPSTSSGIHKVCPDNLPDGACCPSRPIISIFEEPDNKCPAARSANTSACTSTSTSKSLSLRCCPQGYTDLFNAPTTQYSKFLVGE